MLRGTKHLDGLKKFKVYTPGEEHTVSDTSAGDVTGACVDLSRKKRQ